MQNASGTSVLRKFSQYERQELENELTRLYLMQDRPVVKSKITMMVNELNNENVPYRAILDGIRGLIKHDLSKITLPIILANIRGREKDDSKRVKCDVCDGRGIVSMQDAEKKYHPFAFGCICPAGKIKIDAGFWAWNGQAKQGYMGIELFKV